MLGEPESTRTPARHGHSPEAPGEALAEADSDAVAAAGHQAAADVDAGARRHAQPGGGREPAAGGDPDRGSAGRRGAAGHRQGRRAGRPAHRGQDRHLGRQRLRVLLQRLPGRRLPVARAAPRSRSCRRSRTRSRPASSLTDHLEWQLSLKTDDADDRAIGRPSSATSTTTATWWRRSSEIAPDGAVAGRRRSSRRCAWCRASIRPASPRATCRSASRCRSRQLGLEGTPTERIVTEHLRLLQNHQIPELSRKMG